jgi:putative thioredoxin
MEAAGIMPHTVEPFRNRAAPFRSGSREWTGKNDYELKSDFAREVLEESVRVPVLVDFWAPWCGPCRLLSPILEKLVQEAAGTWKLVTVDTDQHPDLSEVLRIRSIPTVYLFSGGQPIATFSGALPENAVRDWLRRYLPSAPAAEKAEVDPVAEALKQGQDGEAKRLLSKKLEKDPADVASRLLLARILFGEDIEKAAETAAAVPEDSEAHEAAMHFLHLRDLARWAKGKDGSRQITGPEPDLALYREGIRDMESGRPDAALEKWLQLVERNRNLDDDGARKALVALLTVLGEDSPLTREYRRRLANALF